MSLHYCRVILLTRSACGIDFALSYASGNTTAGREGPKEMPVTLTHKKIFDLLPETNYSISVKAVTSVGQGPSQSVIARTRKYARQYIHCCLVDRLQ